jgi:hypothetical protein
MKGCGSFPVGLFFSGKPGIPKISQGQRILFLTPCFVLLWVTVTFATGVQVLFNVESLAGGLFPSDLFTVTDPSQDTGLRVKLPFPNCAARPSDCADLAVINTLDGFNLQPRLSIPFSGPINVNTVTSATVFLVSLGSTLPGGNPGGQVVGINQAVWDPATNTLHVESDELLDQHTRYTLFVTRGVRDLVGDPVEASEAFARFRHDLNFGQTKDPALKAYRKALLTALAAARAAGVQPGDLVAASVFTTQSTTADLEKIRDQIKATIPDPADFLLADGGTTRTVFPLANVVGVTFNRQIGTAPTFDMPRDFTFLLKFSFPGAVSQIAFGKYLSPDYETVAKVIPPVGTLSGTPAVQSMNEIFFNLYLPSGPKPVNGWPVAIFGHGFTDSKQGAPFFVASAMAAKGIATIAVNAVGHGGGPLSMLTVSRFVGLPVTLSAGGRSIDQNNDGTIDSTEGVSALSIVSSRDGVRQTVVDLLQLVREIQVGMDVDGDTVPDLDPSRIYYFGQSFGGIYGTLFLAVEPDVSVGVSNVPGGAAVEVTRLGVFRPLVGLSLLFRVPSLINVGGPTGIEFNENMPLRNQLLVINTVPGATAIQEVLENAEWVQQAGNPVAYAPHLRKAPLDGVPAKAVIYQFARGDKTVPNPTTTAILRAGDLADRATFYRNDIAFEDPLRNPNGVEVPDNPHVFLLFNPFFFPNVADVGLFGAQQQIAEFFATNGAVVIDPDGPGSLFEVPIIPPLPEDLGFVP